MIRGGQNRPRARPRQPPAIDLLKDLTELAEKYGHPEGPRHDAISYQFPFKSGLTPQKFPDPNAPEAEYRTFEEIDLYQRKRLRGIPAHDLLAMEALAPLISHYPETRLDSTPIHPLYHQNNWNRTQGRHLAMYPLGGGLPGYWQVRFLSFR